MNTEKYNYWYVTLNHFYLIWKMKLWGKISDSHQKDENTN